VRPTGTKKLATPYLKEKAGDTYHYPSHKRDVSRWMAFLDQFQAKTRDPMQENN
jgi:hypothetical protein